MRVAAQLADLGGDVVAHLRRVRHVVVHLHVRRADGIDDAQVLGGAEPRLDAEDHAALLGLAGDACQPADHLRLPLGVVPQVASLEEREQDDANVERAGAVDAVADPLLGAGIRLVGNLVEHVEGDRRRCACRSPPRPRGTRAAPRAGADAGRSRRSPSTPARRRGRAAAPAPARPSCRACRSTSRRRRY